MLSVHPPSFPTPERQIYTNRTLNLRAIKAIGYDMDYTLIHYRVEAWERAAYLHTKTKLLQAGAIDLKKWVAAIDLTADRAGFIIANDLELANEMIKAADEASSAVQQKDRLKELMLYAVSEEYFALRQKLGINIDG